MQYVYLSRRHWQAQPPALARQRARSIYNRPASAVEKSNDGNITPVILYPATNHQIGS